MRDNVKVYLLYWLPVLIYCYIIFNFSSRESIRLIPSVSHIDKVLHMIAYGVLGILLVRAFQKTSTYNRKRIALLAIIFAAIYGISDEIHQSFVVSRTADIYDVIFDTLGAAIAVQVYSLLSQKVKKSGIL
ncbi:MAG: VanZ family protein [Nitrospinota bacterium]